MVIIWKAANIFRRWDRLSLFLFTVSRTFLCTTNKPTVFLLVEVRTKLKMGLPPRRGEHGPYFAQVKGYSANPKTIGEAIRKRRLDLDLRQMDDVWAHAEHVRCVHPGWGLLTGWDAVRQSWEAIFKHSEEMRFSITDVNVYVEGIFGWVTCTENILSENRGKISVTSVLATNIYERSAGEWRMIHHHASHILTSEPDREG